MKDSRYMIGLLIGGLIFLGTGCSETKGSENPRINVEVRKVEIFDGNEAFAYSGTIEASESTPLSFSVNGTVSRVFVSEGDFVRKGQLLAQLNEATLQNAFDMSRASLERAEDAYRRLKPMHDKGSLPEIKFVEIETGLQQAKSAAAIARKNLSDCRLYATVDGFIGARSIEPGMNVLPGLTAIRLLSIERVDAGVSISENEIALIKKGQEASIMVGAIRDMEFRGTVEEIGVQADPIAHTYRIKIGIPNTDYAIKPGMICEVKIVNLETVSSVVIPNQAVQVDENRRTFVFSVDERANKVTREYVETGRLTNDGIEITSGLTDGELVVVAGQQKLVDNSPVQIVNR